MEHRKWQKSKCTNCYHYQDSSWQRKNNNKVFLWLCWLKPYLWTYCCWCRPKNMTVIERLEKGCDIKKLCGLNQIPIKLLGINCNWYYWSLFQNGCQQSQNTKRQGSRKMVLCMTFWMASCIQNCLMVRENCYVWVLPSSATTPSLFRFFWTSDPFATRLCLMIQQQKPCENTVLLWSWSQRRFNFIECLSIWYVGN